MEEVLIKAIRSHKISEMKNPCILINPEDFKQLKEEVKSKIQNFEIDHNPKFCGLPIGQNNIIEKGKFIIFDMPIF